MINKLHLKEGDRVTVDGHPCTAHVFGPHDEFVTYFDEDDSGYTIQPDVLSPSIIRRLPAKT